jgi:hypothetical protein
VRKPGVGFGQIVGQGTKNPLDGAFKTIKSDIISTAAKPLGDAFCLFLYAEKKKFSNAGGYSSSNNSSTKKGFPVSTGRIPHLLKLGYTQEQVNSMTNDQAKQFFDLHWTQKIDASEAAQKAGLPSIPVQ